MESCVQSEKNRNNINLLIVI